ncbi:AAA family ATPase [Methanococcus voltae]|uniref:CO dehydrogenase maturation factor n=2 Tax=Methanococcus voltae TaxID=2188 RepID=A0A8J7RQ80_METVO|nr:AAA family ATPase [Methanococcus voltae]MBP2173217.1 CO dehydrogenase maturation factor [Methanococcus voltae]MBP2202264.1 CO dehydrogenase maturation factor [Methanococcus voltae]MCS3922951.1 CO dehydrogenase maturation factor [Methanococcus voltae PS]
MSKLIICGRGGCGKSTLITLMAQKIEEQGKKVLIVDSDESNLGLSAMVGIKSPEKTLMDYLGGRPLLDGKLMEVFLNGENEKLELLSETSLDKLPSDFVSWNGNKGFMQIGKIEHNNEGCACPMGVIGNDFLNNLVLNKDEWVLIDTEAGVEHFGRGTVEQADAIIMVVDPSNDAVLLSEKIAKLSDDADKPFGVVLNRVDDETKTILEDAISKKNISIMGAIPYSKTMARENLVGNRLDNNMIEGNVGDILKNLENHNLDI